MPNSVIAASICRYRRGCQPPVGTMIDSSRLPEDKPTISGRKFDLHEKKIRTNLNHIPPLFLHITHHATFAGHWRCRHALLFYFWSTLSMAKKPGVSRVSVTAWENGTAKPDREHLHQLAYALPLSTSYQTPSHSSINMPYRHAVSPALIPTTC